MHCVTYNKEDLLLYLLCHLQQRGFIVVRAVLAATKRRVIAKLMQMFIANNRSNVSKVSVVSTKRLTSPTAVTLVTQFVLYDHFKETKGEIYQIKNNNKLAFLVVISVS